MPTISSQKTLLQLVTDFCGRAGLPIPSAVMGSSNTRVVQIRSLLEEVGQFLVSEFNFQQLKRDATFTSTATESQGALNVILGDEASAFDHIVPGTVWDRTLRKEIYGGMSDRDWQLLKAAMVGGPLYQYRIANNEFLVTPTMAADHEVALTWISKNWISSADGNTLGYSFVADTDRPQFNDTLMLAGLRAYYAREKGLPYADLFADFMARAENESGRSNASKSLAMDGGVRDLRPGIWVPSGNWSV